MPDSGADSDSAIVDCFSGEGGREDCAVVVAICVVTRELIGATLGLALEIGRGKRLVGDPGCDPEPVVCEVTAAVVMLFMDGVRVNGLDGDLSLET